MTTQFWKRAERDLSIPVQGSRRDLTVWDHSARVARTAQLIACLPEIAKDSPSSDVLAVAALYHEMGWVLQVHAGRVSREELLLRPTSDLCRDIAADWMEVHLQSLMPGGVLERAAAVVRQSGDRRSDLIEVHVLADADNLDQIGPQAIEWMIRKCCLEGRTLEHLLAGWERQEEYQYWQARIKESFRFTVVKDLAVQRHQALRRCMADLAVAIRLTDVAGLGAFLQNGDGTALPHIPSSPEA